MARPKKTQPSPEASGMEKVQGLMEGLLDSYEVCLRGIESLMARTTEALEKSRQDQERTMEELREFLAQKESLRRKDFDALMGAVRTHRREKEGEVREMVASFLLRGQAALKELRGLVSNGGGLRIEECRALGQRILGEHESFEQEIGKALLNFHLEQEELSTGLKKILAKGEGARVRHLKALARALHARQSLDKSEVGSFLEELDGLRGEVVSRWRKVLAAGTPLSQEA